MSGLQPQDAARERSGGPEERGVFETGPRCRRVGDVVHVDEVDRSEAASLGERVVGTDDTDEVVVEQEPAGERPGGRPCLECDVGAAIGEKGLHVARRGSHGFETGRLGIAAEVGDRSGEPWRVIERIDGENECGLTRRAEPLCLDLPRCQGTLAGASRFDEPLTGGGERESATLPERERKASSSFGLLQPLACCGLRDEQPICRTADRAGSGQFEEQLVVGSIQHIRDTNENMLELLLV